MGEGTLTVVGKGGLTVKGEKRFLVEGMLTVVAETEVVWGLQFSCLCLAMVSVPQARYPLPIHACGGDWWVESLPLPLPAVMMVHHSLTMGKCWPRSQDIIKSDVSSSRCRWIFVFVQDS